MMMIALTLVAMTLAAAGVISGFSRQPFSEAGAAVLSVVVLPYALVLWWSLRGQIARASAMAFGAALIAFIGLILFAGLFTLFLGFAMGNQDQINFALLLDAFVLVQVPLGIVAWRAYRGVPAAERPRGCWIVGFGLPLLVAGGIVAAYNGVKFGMEDRLQTIYRNEQAAREAMDAAAACLKRHAERDGGYPADFGALGSAGDRCLDDRLIAGDLPSHRLRYSPGMPDANGRSVLYGLCAEVTGFKATAWRTYVTDETGQMQQFEPRTRGPTCGEAWGGDKLVEHVKYCAVAYAARFPQRGYPATLDLIGVHPGTGCLAPSDLAKLHFEGDGLVASGEQQARYQAGGADAQGRISTFEIQGEQLLAGRWRVKVMIDEVGRWHAAEGRDPTRNDPPPAEFEKTLQAREVEREAARAAGKLRCEAGDARLCRDLGGTSYDAQHDTEAFALWQTGCDKGDGVSCLLTMNQSDFRLFYLANTLRNDCLREEAGVCGQLEKLGRDHLACQRGDQAGCSWLAIRLGQRGETFHANKIWEKACATGHRESCYLLKARDFEYKGAMQLKDLCDEGRRDACSEFEQRMVEFLAKTP